MIRKIIFIIFAIGLSYGAMAQGDINDVLSRIERSNKELQAQKDLTIAQQLEARTSLSLSNPTVSYDNLWGGPKDGNRAMGELTIAQPFDFPSAYFSRSSIAKMKVALYNSEGASYRQELLLRAKQICLEIIFLRKQNTLLNERLQSAGSLKKSYKQKLDAGSANIMEINKIELEYITVSTQLKLNNAALKTETQKLETMLGGEEVNFTQNAFPQEDPLPSIEMIEAIYASDDPKLKGLEKQIDIDSKNISLAKSLAMPQLEVGYRHNFGADGRFSGFTVGMSLPIFESRNKVKLAKAQSVASTSRLKSAQLDNISTVRQLYDEAISYKESINSLKALLQSQNNRMILDKALTEGQISIIEYFAELNTIFQSKELIVQMERSYSLAMTQLYRYKL